MMSLQKTDQVSSPEHARFFINVLAKGLILFLIFNLVFALGRPLDKLGRLSAYNYIFPGRKRLPYSDHPERAYNLSLFNLEAMLASHELAGSAKTEQEYRVILIGDSSTWGFLLPAEHTLSASLNSTGLQLPDGRYMRVYNLGYPVMSLTKDLLILSYAIHYQPDLIIWPVTLESFPYDKQLFPPLIQNNPAPVKALIQTYHLALDADSPQFNHPSLAGRTLAGSRRALADLIRLQLYGVMWAATGIDQDIPETYTSRMEDLPAEQNFHDLQPPHLQETALALDVLATGVIMAGDIPVLIINEPMFISRGENSAIRYNFFYPRWAYDDYRQIMLTTSIANGWHYQDMWDSIPATEFTNSAIHLTSYGTELFSQYIAETILEMASKDIFSISRGGVVFKLNEK